MELDEGAEFFVVPIYDENGKEIRREFIPACKKIPLADEKGNLTSDTIEAEDAIEAVQKYPGESLRKAKKKLLQEYSQQTKK